MALPLFALSAFLTIPAPKAHADNGCPTDEYPYSNIDDSGTCGDGHDSGVAPGQSGIFVFCNADEFGDPGGGPGYCDPSGSGYTCCTYGW